MQQEVDVDPRLAEHVHDADALVLELEKLLDVKLDVFKFDSHEPGMYLKQKENGCQIHLTDIQSFNACSYFLLLDLL